MIAEFVVDGVPVPQGSKTIGRGGGKVWLRDANAGRLKPWREKVATAARETGSRFDGPVTVTLIFTMPRPKRPRFKFPAVKPDLDKLERAVFDGLTDGGLIADDALVVEVWARKEYGPEPHVFVCVADVYR